MSPKLIIRTFSDDQYCLDKVFYENIYRLRGSKEAKPIIVDIGAHCGYFTFTALALGAAKVYAFEPFAENYKILLQNIPESMGKVIPHQIGVYPMEEIISFLKPELTKDKMFNFSNPTLTIAGTTEYSAPFYPLGKLINIFVKEHVDILKFSIGYSDIEIFKNPKLEKVTSICGESKFVGEQWETFKNTVTSKGFTSSHVQPLKMEGENNFLFWFSRKDVKEVFKIE